MGKLVNYKIARNHFWSILKNTCELVLYARGVLWGCQILIFQGWDFKLHLLERTWELLTKVSNYSHIRHHTTVLSYYYCEIIHKYVCEIHKMILTWFLSYVLLRSYLVESEVSDNSSQYQVFLNLTFICYIRFLHI